jgi:hypothetical protein
VKPLPGDPRGLTPLASLAEAEKPHGFFDEAVHGGLPQCETCLITRNNIDKKEVFAGGSVVLRGGGYEWNAQCCFPMEITLRMEGTVSPALTRGQLTVQVQT